MGLLFEIIAIKCIQNRIKTMKQLSDQKIVESWKNNIGPWIQAIQNEEIESRVLTTNQAIIDTVLQFKPKTILDVGCGEGWLIRRLAKEGIHGLGVDIIPAFIEYAQKQKVGQFKVLAYENFHYDSILRTFDAIVCNFSLLGKESVEHIFKQAPALLNENGRLIIQTIHPLEANGSEVYQDGWRPGSWTGFSEQFSDPAPWYFRTLDSWIQLFISNDFDKPVIYETVQQTSGKKMSIIFTGQVKKPNSI